MAIIKDDEYYTNLGKEAVKTARETSLQQNNDLYQQQTDMANKAYETEAEQANRSYEDQYRENAVQKEINKRQVAESMANLGLTDSGLNRTQQTAVQLSYANNKANIDRNKQTNLENINLSRLQDLSSIDQKRLSSDAEINQYYDNLAQQYAADYKKADVDAYKSAVKSVSNAKNDTYKFSTTEVEKLKELYTSNGSNDEARKMVIKYLTAIGKEPQNDAENRIVNLAIGYEDNSEHETKLKENGGSYYSQVLTYLKNEKNNGKSNSEISSYLKDLLNNDFISSSEATVLYNKYRNNNLG